MEDGGMTYDEALEELLDLDLAPRSAEIAAAWVVSTLAEAHAEATTDAVVRVLGALFDGKREQLRARAIGMAFAIGRPDLAGYLTLDQAAMGEGCSHTMVANWRKAALEALGGPR
jgi:hypothetical protein